MCRSKHVEPSINFGIINSITKLHLVGISTESSTMHGSVNIKLPVILDFFFNIGNIPNLRGSTHQFTLKGEIAVMRVIYPTVVPIIFHIMKIKLKYKQYF